MDHEGRPSPRPRPPKLGRPKAEMALAAMNAEDGCGGVSPRSKPRKLGRPKAEVEVVQGAEEKGNSGNTDMNRNVFKVG